MDSLSPRYVLRRHPPRQRVLVIAQLANERKPVAHDPLLENAVLLNEAVRDGLADNFASGGRAIGAVTRVTAYLGAHTPPESR